jgi:hypothetical protein
VSAGVLQWAPRIHRIQVPSPARMPSSSWFRYTAGAHPPRQHPNHPNLGALFLTNCQRKQNGRHEIIRHESNCAFRSIPEWCTKVVTDKSVILGEMKMAVVKRCIADTLSGQRCPWNALDGSNYCGMHSPNAEPPFRVMKAMKKATKKAAKKSSKKK